MELIDTKIIVAFIAVFASFVGLIISKEQKISEFRQAWINTLRDDIAKFLGQVDSVKKLILINKTSKEDEKKETSTAVILGSVEMREIKSKIELLIDPAEENHLKLVQLLNKIIVSLRKLESNDENVNDLIKLSQSILKEEWKKVKDGEPIFKFFKWVFGITTVGIILYVLYKIMCG